MPLSSPAPVVADAAAARRARDGEVLMVVAGLLLGTVGVFVQEAGQPAPATVWFRCVFGLAALLAWSAFSGRWRELASLRWQGVAAVAAAGGLMVASWGLFFAAIPRCSIAESTVVFHLQPFWLLGLGALWLGDRVAPLQWAAVGVALAGLALASGLGDAGAMAGSAGTAHGGHTLGLLLSLVGSLLYAGSALIARRATAQVGSFALAIGPCAVGALVLLPWPLVQGLPAAGAAWGWLAGLGVLHTGLAYVLLYAGMARLPTGRFAVLQFVYPATAVLLDWAVYGRALSPWQLVGVGLIGLALWKLRRPA